MNFGNILLNTVHFYNSRGLISLVGGGDVYDV